MDIDFSVDKKFTGCELINIANRLKCYPPTLEEYGCDFASYSLVEVPGMSYYNLKFKISFVLNVLGCNVDWLHLYFGYGRTKTSIHYCKWSKTKKIMSDFEFENLIG